MYDSDVFIFQVEQELGKQGFQKNSQGLTVSGWAVSGSTYQLSTSWTDGIQRSCLGSKLISFMILASLTGSSLRRNVKDFFSLPSLEPTNTYPVRGSSQHRSTNAYMCPVMGHLNSSHRTHMYTQLWVISTQVIKHTTTQNISNQNLFLC